MSIPQPSRVPLVVAALVAVAQEMKTDGDVDVVLYGPTPKAATSGRRTLAVFFGGPGSPGARARVDAESDVETFSGVTYVETVDVACNAISWGGGTDVQPHHDAAYAIVDALRLKLDADPKLGGLCERATLGQSSDAFPVSEGSGASVEVAFTVRVQSYI